MTEISFNDLTARVGMATIATIAVKVKGLVLETVTATVINLYVYWKLGFRMEALLS